MHGKLFSYGSHPSFCKLFLSDAWNMFSAKLEVLSQILGKEKYGKHIFEHPKTSFCCSILKVRMDSNFLDHSCAYIGILEMKLTDISMYHTIVVTRAFNSYHHHVCPSLSEDMKMKFLQNVMTCRHSILCG